MSGYSTYLIGTEFRGHLISRFWRDIISRGFIFAISIGKYEKRAKKIG